MEVEEGETVKSRVFSAYGRPLEVVTSSRYLGRVILAADDDWPAVIWNLIKAQALCRRMMRILIREVERPRVFEFFFKAVVWSVFLFDAETCVFTPRMGRVLGGSQYHVTW